jgi:hypothetical protein
LINHSVKIKHKDAAIRNEIRSDFITANYDTIKPTEQNTGRFLESYENQTHTYTRYSMHYATENEQTEKKNINKDNHSIGNPLVGYFLQFVTPGLDNKNQKYMKEIRW